MSKKSMDQEQSRENYVLFNNADLLNKYHTRLDDVAFTDALHTLESKKRSDVTVYFTDNPALTLWMKMQNALVPVEKRSASMMKRLPGNHNVLFFSPKIAQEIEIENEEKKRNGPLPDGMVEDSETQRMFIEKHLNRMVTYHAQMQLGFEKIGELIDRGKSFMTFGLVAGIVIERAFSEFFKDNPKVRTIGRLAALGIGIAAEVYGFTQYSKGLVNSAHTYEQSIAYADNETEQRLQGAQNFGQTLTDVVY